MIEAMQTILELFATSFFGTLVVGAVCPLIGVFFLLRRMVFLGVAVPQFAAAGVGFSTLIFPWCFAVTGGEGACHEAMEAAFGLHLFWAMAFALAALLALAWLGWKYPSNPEGRIAAAYALAAAGTILFLSASALGSSHAQTLLRGEILTLSAHEFQLICILFGTVFVLFLCFHRPFLLCGYDREAACSLGVKCLGWDFLLYGLVGFSISTGVLTVGPLVIFGLMVFPPLTGRLLAFNMFSFYVFASLVGVLTAGLGFVGAYMLDWPMGPTVVTAAFAVLALTWLVRPASRPS